MIPRPGCRPGGSSTTCGARSPNSRCARTHASGCSPMWLSAEISWKSSMAVSVEEVVLGGGGRIDVGDVGGHRARRDPEEQRSKEEKEARGDQAVAQRLCARRLGEQIANEPDKLLAKTDAEEVEDQEPAGTRRGPNRRQDDGLKRT